MSRLVNITCVWKFTQEKVEPSKNMKKFYNLLFIIMNRHTDIHTNTTHQHTKCMKDIKNNFLYIKFFIFWWLWYTRYVCFMTIWHSLSLNFYFNLIWQLNLCFILFLTHIVDPRDSLTWNIHIYNGQLTTSVCMCLSFTKSFFVLLF